MSSNNHFKVYAACFILVIVAVYFVHTSNTLALPAQPPTFASTLVEMSHPPIAGKWQQVASLPDVADPQVGATMPTPIPSNSTLHMPTAGSIHGHVTANGTNVPNIALSLRRYDDTSDSKVADAITDANGYYTFNDVPTLTAGFKYYVAYGPNSSAPRYGPTPTPTATSLPSPTPTLTPALHRVRLPLIIKQPTPSMTPTFTPTNTPTPTATATSPSGIVARASQNLSIDPMGRVIDVTFNQDVNLHAPWDRFRFSLDIVQPLAKDGGAFLRDMTGDGTPDLFLTDWQGRLSFYPGMTGDPQRFGDGTYLKHAWDFDPDPYYGPGSGHWLEGDIADLNGDGKKDVVVGILLFENAGSAYVPKLDWQYTFLTPDKLGSTPNSIPTRSVPNRAARLQESDPEIANMDPSATIGDLNADSKPDVVITFNYSGNAWVFWNHSTPGTYAFTAQLLNSWSFAANNQHLSLGDLNGDSLLDLVSPAGIYYNTGTAQVPQFDFTTPSAWNTVGGPEWISDNDCPPHVFLQDADGDGLLDAYVSRAPGTVWQSLYFHNAGTRQAHRLEYQGPVVASGSPLWSGNRGYLRPGVFSWQEPLISTADIDQNNLPDLLLSDADGDMGTPTIVWGFPGAVASTPDLQLSYQDLYTWPDLPKVNYTCGARMAYQADALCRPPNMFSAWLDLSGDSLSDVLHIDTWMDAYQLYRTTRTGTWPFSLERWDFKQDTPIRSNPSGNQITGLGVTFADIDHDGTLDLVTGSKDGRLLYHRNTAISGPPTYADPVPLADAAGRVITVGENSWPLALDLDGDGDLDFLVGEDSGKIYKVICQNPGQINGYLLGGALGTLEQDPLNIMHLMGGGIFSPSLSAADMDRDGLLDVVISNIEGGVWLLRNTTSNAAPVYSIAPLIVSRTAAAYLDILDRRQIRLYFALPTVAGQTNLRWDNVPTADVPLTGMTTIITP